MQLNTHDLKQLDDRYLCALPQEALQRLSSKLLSDLKEAHDRLNQNSSNSSRPPSSQSPWENREEIASGDDDEEKVPREAGSEGATDPRKEGKGEDDAADGQKDKPSTDAKDPKTEPKPSGRLGKRPGEPGYGRTQTLPIDKTCIHRPTTCGGCSAPLSETCESSAAYTARYELELESPAGGGHGLVLVQTKHVYYESQCSCGHCTREQPGRCRAEEGWSVELTEWHLAGPLLVVFICALAMRQRLSRARIQEFLRDWFGLSLSRATINQCIHEGGRAVEPVVKEGILNAVREAEILYADETSWKEQGALLWLWVFTCTTVTFFIVGKRTREMVVRVLGEAFENWLMSDGYGVYRDVSWRLRCWAHILRKARGLEESLDQEAHRFGRQVLTVFKELMAAVYQARGSPPESPLRSVFAETLAELFATCLEHAESKHEKTRALARELLNDWDTFWVILDYPWLPLTNNAAERALRHWVIARRISHGTRTPQGTHAFGLLASVIETCRQRAVSPWPYLAEVIRQRRKDLPAPPLPLPTAG